MRALMQDRLCVRFLALFVAVQCADLAVTAVGLHAGTGGAGITEGNPLPAFLILHLSFPVAVLVKLLVYNAALGTLLPLLYVLDRTIAVAFLIVACTFYLGAVGWNLYTLVSVLH
jgi:hypothetical protein